jgi:vitamin B12 transporter
MRRHATLAGLLVPSLLLAEPPAGPSPDTITVTAYRTPQDAARAGSALSVVDRADITVRQATNAAEALRTVPGLAIARTGPIGAQTQVRMRGAEANHLLVFIDGVEANDLATDDSFSFEHLGSFDIERIEVVRGPQSALWGSDALAGVVNVITRRPDGPLEADGFLEGGSFGFWNGGASAGAASSAASVIGSATRTDVAGTNASLQGDEDDGYENTTARLAGSLTLAPGLALEATVRRTEATTEFDGNDYVDGVLVAVDADNATDVAQTYLRAGLRLDLLDGRLAQSLHYGVADTETDTAAEESFDDGNPGDGGYDRTAVTGGKYGLYYQASLRLGAGTADEPADLVTLALEHERQEFSQRGEPSFFGDPNQDQSLRANGVALEYVAFVGAGLSLSASARHDDNSDFDDVNTWRTTASWAVPGRDTRLHASFGTGQKNPTFYERYGYTPDTFVGNPELAPERSRGWDAGVEQRWLDGRVRADATYFRADLEDEIDGFYCPPPEFACTAVNEDGESDRRGVETVLTAELTPAVALAASYTYTDARQSDPQPDGTDPGVSEVRRPRHSGSLNLTGRLLDGRLVLDAGVYYVGEREDDAFLDAPPFTRRVTLDEYSLVNLAASYEVGPRLSVYGRVENALDEDYQDVFGYASPGIGGFVGLRASFAP